MGIVGLSRIIAMEGAMKNVRSNTIAPFAWTRMIATIPVKDEASAKRVERMKNMMRADQVAQLAVALASPATKDVSGQIFAARGNEIFLMSQPRPIRGIGKVEGWTPETIANHCMPALEPSFFDMGATTSRVRLGPDLNAHHHLWRGSRPVSSASRRAAPSWILSGGLAGSAQQISRISRLGLKRDASIGHIVEHDQIGGPGHAAGVERDERGRLAVDEPDLFAQFPQHGPIGRLARADAAARQRPAYGEVRTDQKDTARIVTHQRDRADGNLGYQRPRADDAEESQVLVQVADQSHVTRAFSARLKDC